jgi:hypothetical protein
VSVDLFVVRAAKLIDERELQEALARVAATVAGFAAVRGQACFDGTPRADVALSPGDDEEEELEELRAPYVVISSRSGAWPWVEYTAVELAKALGGGVFSPMDGEMYAELVAEHTLEQLRELALAGSSLRQLRELPRL